MKKSLYCLVLFASMWFVPPIFATPFLQNPGFEKCSNGDSIPGWNVNYWYGTPVQKIMPSGEKPFRGKKSLKVNLSKTNRLGKFGLTIFQSLPKPKPNQRIVVVFNYWSDTQIPLKISVSSEPDNGVPYVARQFKTHQDGKWHKVELSLPASKFVPENILWKKSKIWLELCVYGKVNKLPAVMYLDDVQVKFAPMPKYVVDSELIQRFYELQKKIKKQEIPESALHRKKMQEIKKLLNKTSAVLKNASKEGISAKQQEEVVKVINWAENKLEVFFSKDKVSCLFDDVEVWAVKPIQNKYTHPNERVIDGKLTDSLNLTLARDQFGPVSFLLRSDRDLKSVHFKIEPFKASNGKVITEITSDIKVLKWWYQDGWAVQEVPSVKEVNPVERTGVKVLLPELLVHDDSLVKVDNHKKNNQVRVYNKSGNKPTYIRIDDPQGFSDKEACYIPDKDTRAFRPLDIKAEVNRQFWLVVNVPKNAPHGKFESNINVYSGEKKLTKIKIKLRVLPFVLEKPPFISSMYYRAPNYLGEADYKISYEQQNIWTQYSKELKNLRDHGVDYVRFSGPGVHVNWNKLKDLSDIKRRLEIRRSLSMPVDIVFLNYPTGAPRTREGLKLLEKRIRRVVEEVKKYGVKEVYFYGFDEAKGKKLRSQLNGWKVVQQAGGKVYAAGFADEMFDSVGDVLDLFICAFYPDRDEIAKWHSNGKKIASYSNPQGGIELPDIYRRCYGLLLWQYDFDAAMTYVYHNGPIQKGGALIYAWNDFCPNPDNSKQHMMVYPTADGVVDTLQWEGYREGINDARYISTLQSLVNKYKNDDSEIQAAQSFLAKLKCGDVVQDDSNLDKIREETIEHILRILNKNNFTQN